MARRGMNRVRHLFLPYALVVGFLAGSAAAQTALDPGTGPSAPQPAEPAASDKPSEQAKPESISDVLPPAFADPGGVRAQLETAGIVYGFNYIGEVLGTARGGIRRDANGQGRLDVQVDADLERLLGLPALVFHANAYVIHGRGASTCCLQNLLTASGIEALPATRLFEAWLEQKAWGGRVSVRAGQLAADTEFMTSGYAGLFVNATFGWPASAAANLPNGGPAYPTATPGARFRVTPNEAFSLSAAIFNGDPVGPNGTAPPQRRDRSGFEFRTTDPAFLIAEAAYAFGGVDKDVLPGTVKLGAWHHFGSFGDRRFGADGLPLADPLGSGIARRLPGNHGYYAVLDQLLVPVSGRPDAGIGGFTRVSAAPSDRNIVDVYADGGLTFKGLLPGRPNDTFGVAAGVLRISGRVRGADRDAAAFRVVAAEAAYDPSTGTFPDGSPAPAGRVRSSEAVLEATYQAALAPGVTLQPDIQYVIRPGAGAANPRDPNGGAVRNAVVVGLRAAIRY